MQNTHEQGIWQTLQASMPETHINALLTTELLMFLVSHDEWRTKKRMKLWRKCWVVSKQEWQGNGKVYPRVSNL